jgi:hypothetical protein
MKARVEVFNKLIRRIKYLQKSFDETIKNLLQYINKFSNEETLNFAKALGIMISTQLVPMNALGILFKEHLVKEGEHSGLCAFSDFGDHNVPKGLSLQFVTNVFKTYLNDQSIEHLGAVLRRNQMDMKLMDYFPANKRTDEFFARHFATEDLSSLVEYYNKRQLSSKKELLAKTLTDMFSSSTSLLEVTLHVLKGCRRLVS